MTRYTYEDPAIGEIIAAIAAIDYALGEYGISAILKRTTPNKKFDLITSTPTSPLDFLFFYPTCGADVPQSGYYRDARRYNIVNGLGISSPLVCHNG